MTQMNNQSGSQTSQQGSHTSQSAPTTLLTPVWRGRPVPEPLATWFDQLMTDSLLLSEMAKVRYLDVTLTCASAAKFAKPPTIVLK